MAKATFPREFLGWIDGLSGCLDQRLRPRLAVLLMGLLFATGRRTVAAWLRGAGVVLRWQRYYYFLGSLGRKTPWIAQRLLQRALQIVPIGERIVLAIDDSPTKRYGPYVEGAGIHHNPTPGPADQGFLYGHVWVTLAWIVHHPRWGAIGLPLLAKLYIRERDVAKLPRWYRWKFQTKLEQAVELALWAIRWLKCLGKPLWFVVDGAYAKEPLLKPLLAAGVTIVSRLRRDAALYSPPPPRKPGQRGRPRKYGERICLAKRAGQTRGWINETLTLYGKSKDKQYKTFLAVYPPAGGMIRVVLVKEESGWIAFFCTDITASVAAILGAVADRSTIEQVFHDVKEVHGAGEQQLRHVWANIGAWHMTLWAHTLVELWSWRRKAKELVDRSRSPWDKADRRPSHADRCKAMRRASLQEHFSKLPTQGPEARKFRKLKELLLAMAA